MHHFLQLKQWSIFIVDSLISYYTLINSCIVKLIVNCNEKENCVSGYNNVESIQNKLLTPSISIVRATIFISGLNNEKSKSKSSIHWGI